MAAVDRTPKLVHMTTIGGTLCMLAGQVGHMRSRGFEVHAISSPDDELMRFGESERIPVHTVAMPRAITPAQDVRAVAGIYRTLRSIRPHIVHAHTPKGGLLGTIAARAARVPVRVYHIHGLPFVTATGGRRALLRTTETMSCRLATRVLCVSRSVRDVAVAEGFCPPEKIAVLGGGSINGVDAEGRFSPARIGEDMCAETRNRYDIPPHAVVLGFVGRIVRDKGMNELVSAWRVLREEFPNLYMLVVGAFEPQDPVLPETEHILLSDERTRLTGIEFDVPPLYAVMDILALPTYREGFPLVPMEAAAMELPVVATRVPGCVDAVQDGVTGVLVPPYDPEALAMAIRAYLGDPDLRRRHGRAGRERMLREFRPRDLWESTYIEYRRLLAEAGVVGLSDSIPEARTESMEAR